MLMLAIVIADVQDIAISTTFLFNLSVETETLINLTVQNIQVG